MGCTSGTQPPGCQHLRVGRLLDDDTDENNDCIPGYQTKQWLYDPFIIHLKTSQPFVIWILPLEETMPTAPAGKSGGTSK